MKSCAMTRRGQVYSVGNYLMTGKVLGKGHFARVEEATHRIVGKKVAIKIIDLTCIKEEYARRNLHREPRVMARLRHPCIAALYETMMHGPRLYVVMEAAGGGDLCAHVLAGRGGTSGLPEARARSLAAQLVSAVRHMHARGVVHRDLKMENIMLDVTKQFIKIVDFGLSNMWSAGGSLRTPCGSLEYAAPELFVDGRRYGPEVDLWSIGVIVYGMVTGGLPFSGGDSGEGKSRAQLRAAISKGFTRKQRSVLACVSVECKNFIQQLLEPHVELRMSIEEAARHKWVRRPGLRMKTHPFLPPDTKTNREIYRNISELVGTSVIDVAAQIKADPFGAVGGIYNIKTHLHQMQAVPGTDLLWSSLAQEPRPCSPPEYIAKYEMQRPDTAPSCSKIIASSSNSNVPINIIETTPKQMYSAEKATASHKITMHHNHSQKTVHSQNGGHNVIQNGGNHRKHSPERFKTVNVTHTRIPIHGQSKSQIKTDVKQRSPTQSPRFVINRPSSSIYNMKKPTYKIHDSGDCGLDPRLPSIEEHSNLVLNDSSKNKNRMNIKTTGRTPVIRKISLEEDVRLSRGADAKKTEFYRRAGDGLPCWRSNGVVPTPPARILLQSNATTIKRASLGNIASPHSSSNSHCKSERAMPIPWFSSRSSLSKDPQHIQRLRRTAPLK